LHKYTIGIIGIIVIIIKSIKIIMSKKLSLIKQLIKDECYLGGKIESYFYDVHLLAVEECAEILLTKLPDADKEIVMLGVWLHDLQRIRGLEGDHAQVGAEQAIKVLNDFEYSEEIINKVHSIILSHPCDCEPYPSTIEGKILATADAMSHYMNDFYLTLCRTGKWEIPEFKVWALKKLDRDYNKKIYFEFARAMIEQKHQKLVAFFSLESSL
jgi:hypothetical protein